MHQSDEQKECESKIWWNDITQLAKNLEKALNEKENKNLIFVQLDEKKLESALEMYERRWWIFKKHIYMERAEEEVIDRHKIISLYILSILAKRPFDVRVRPENKICYLENINPDNMDLFLANELFSLSVMQVLIFAWDKNKNKKIFEMDGNEIKWLKILLNNIKLNLENMSFQFVEAAPKVTDILSLAQIVYYIEEKYRQEAEALDSATRNIL